MHPTIASRLARLIAALALTAAPIFTFAADAPTKPDAKTTAPKTDAPPSNPPKTDAKTDALKKDDKKDPKKDEPKLPYPSPSSPQWKMTILKEKPEVQVPSVVAVAPDGRIFFAEDPMDQKGPGNVPSDRVLCLHPDGRMTVFADKLYAVFGIAYYDGKLFVHHSPKFTVYIDDIATGVGKDPVDYYDTDNPATWGGGNLNDHIPAQIRLGMDGWFYMSTGDKGVYGLVSKIDKSTAEIKGGGVVRFRPDGSQWEVYATGTRNHLDISINAEDEIFSYDNTDDGLGWNTRFTHLVDGGFYGYPYDYRPRDEDAEGQAKWKTSKEEMTKAKEAYDKAVKEAIKDAKTDEEKAAILAKLDLKKPSQLVPQFRPYTLWAMEDWGGGSPTGAIAYNEDALPPEYRGNLFHSEWGKGAFERIVVERTGATYKVTKRDDKFLKGGTQPFRPLGVTITPDGMGFYICDWNINGWNSKQAYDAGRLIQLSFTGQSLAAPKPQWYIPAAMGQKFEASTTELIAGLAHPAQSVRLVAQRRIGERGAEAVGPLIALLNDTSASKEARWSAIWTLDRIDEGKAGRNAIIALLTNTQIDVSIRMQAARQLGTRKAKEAVAPLTTALDDPDAAMRFRAATALGRIGDAQPVPALINKLTEKDLFTRYAVFTALNRIGRASPPAWEQVVQAFSSDKPEIRQGALFATRNAFDQSLVSALSNYAANPANPTAGRTTAIEALAPLSKQPKPWTGNWWGTRPQNQSLPPAHEVDWAGTTNAQGTVRKALEDPDKTIRAAAIASLQTSPDAAMGDLLAKLFKSEKDTTIRKSLLKALAASKAPEATAIVTDVLGHASANAELLPDALALAATTGGDASRDAVISLLAADLPAETRTDLLTKAIDALGKMKDHKAAPTLAQRAGDTQLRIAISATLALGQTGGKVSLDALLDRLLHDNRTDIRRAAAVALATVKNRDAIPALLDVYKDKEIGNDAIRALCAMPTIKALDAYLAGVSSPDGGLRSDARKAITSIKKEALPLIEARLDTNPLSTQAISEIQGVYAKEIPEKDRASKLWKFDTKKLAPEAFANFAKANHGNADNGKKLFKNENLACIKCHKIGNEGADIGPLLSGVGAKYDRTFLIESVLYPSKQILDGYQQTIVRLKDGDVQSGVIKAETDKDITLFDAAATKTVIPKSDIKEREHGKLSLMPEGLHLALKPEEFADLIAYLESLKESAPPQKDAAKK
ncbi:MAG: putative rane-bound dehydrogenase [Phycisphaerales bacterium]|nr:putative rane-bound dehydrogenase [Phycisphaerales bacterium]